MSLLEQFADMEVPQESTGQTAELPEKAWFIFKTAPADSKATPSLKLQRDDLAFFKTGLIVAGGAEEQRHFKGRWLFGDQALWEFGAPGTLAGKFVGLVNTFVSPGVGDDLKGKERSAARWKESLTALEAFIEENNLDFSAYAEKDNYRDIMLGCAFAAYLADKGGTIVGQVKYKRGKENKDVVEKIVLGAFDDFTPAVLAKRKLIEYVDETDCPF